MSFPRGAVNPQQTVGTGYWATDKREIETGSGDRHLSWTSVVRMTSPVGFR